ncbi:hypothetical protein L1887_13564 [Cichorium endivia]|nr:hypothetical protein L1887_13564 [Cichorium endivia]
MELIATRRGRSPYNVSCHNVLNTTTTIITTISCALPRTATVYGPSMKEHMGSEISFVGYLSYRFKVKPMDEPSKKVLKFCEIFMGLARTNVPLLRKVPPGL